MLLSAQNVKKEYGIQKILDIGRLEIQDGDRIGLIGRNGTGKSTLLGVLSRRIAADGGSVRRSCEIAEILQTAEILPGDENDGPEERLISRMRLRGSAVKSGGERTRLAIAAAFSKRAPLLFADEPTTNLDLDGVNALEKMQAGSRGASRPVPGSVQSPFCPPFSQHHRRAGGGKSAGDPWNCSHIQQSQYLSKYETPC